MAARCCNAYSLSHSAHDERPPEEERREITVAKRRTSRAPWRAVMSAAPYGAGDCSADSGTSNRSVIVLTDAAAV